MGYKTLAGGGAGSAAGGNARTKKGGAADAGAGDQKLVLTVTEREFREFAKCVEGGLATPSEATIRAARLHSELVKKSR